MSRGLTRTQNQETLKPVRLLAALLLVVGTAACGHQKDRENFSNISGNWAGSLRAGDRIPLHQVTLNLTQFDRDLGGTMVYDGTRTFTVTGRASYGNADITFTEAGCATPVKSWVEVNASGLTVGFQGDTGCGLISASGLLTH